MANAAEQEWIAKKIASNFSEFKLEFYVIELVTWLQHSLRIWKFLVNYANKIGDQNGRMEEKKIASKSINHNWSPFNSTGSYQLTIASSKSYTGWNYIYRPFINFFFYTKVKDYRMSGFCCIDWFINNFSLLVFTSNKFIRKKSITK